MNDTFRHQGLRKILINSLSNKGIYDKNILNAMMKIPRHLFMDNAFDEFAYKDNAFPIGNGQTISQPYTVAFQTQLLSINKYEKVLEVGTGSGYQAAVLSLLNLDVFTIERNKELFSSSKILLNKLGYKCNSFYGDGYNGLKKFAPFDKIIVTCGAPYIPDQLILQLKIGGKMVVPVGKEKSHVMTLIEKKSSNNFITSNHGDFSFVPMLFNKN